MTFFERVGVFFASLPSELYVFIISMLPIVELRGSIPVGAALGLPFYSNYLISILGNLLPVPFVLLFIPRILDFLARFKFFAPIVKWLRDKADKHSHKVIKDHSGAERVVMSGGIFAALLLFVAIPLPGTGAWTGSLVAALFSLSKKWSLFAIALGVLISGAIMSLASYGVLGFLSFLL